MNGGGGNIFCARKPLIYASNNYRITVMYAMNGFIKERSYSLNKEDIGLAYVIEKFDTRGVLFMII